MKSSKQKTILKVVLFFNFIFVASSAVFSQTHVKSPSPNFLILVESTKDGLKLTGQEGCAWKELTFKINQDRPQAIDQYGMTSLDKGRSAEDNNLSSFLFIIKKTKEGISLEGKEGTSWSNLNFSCTKCYQYIDGNGMTSKN